jgi:hypothetical protein
VPQLLLGTATRSGYSIEKLLNYPYNPVQLAWSRLLRSRINGTDPTGWQGRRLGADAKNITFGEGDDVVVLVAEAAVAAPETAADDVASGVLPPPLRVPPRHNRRLAPARRSGLPVKGPRAVLLSRRRAPAAAVVAARRGRTLHPGWTDCFCLTVGS